MSRSGSRRLAALLGATLALCAATAGSSSAAPPLRIQRQQAIVRFFETSQKSPFGLRLRTCTGHGSSARGLRVYGCEFVYAGHRYRGCFTFFRESVAVLDVEDGPVDLADGRGCTRLDWNPFTGDFQIVRG